MFCKKAHSILREKLIFAGVKYTATKIIGHGATGDIYATQDKARVIKLMILETFYDLIKAVKEVKYHVQCHEHSNIVTIYSVLINNIDVSLKEFKACDPKELVSKYQLQQYPCKFMILMERGGSSVVDYLLQSKEPLSQTQILQIFGGLVSGFSAIHKQNVVHRDCKLENLLVTLPFHYSNVRICDFGSCSKADEFADSNKLITDVGLRNQLLDEISENTTPCCRAPELINVHSRLPIGPKLDIFACGVSLFRLMYRTLPFPDGEQLANFNCRYTFPAQPQYQDELKEIIRQCLVQDPQKRPTIVQLCKAIEALLEEAIGYVTDYEETKTKDGKREGEGWQEFYGEKMDLMWE